MGKGHIKLLSEVDSNAFGFALSRFIQQHKGKYICFVDSITLAETLYKQLNYFVQVFSHRSEVLLLKDREILPYDTVSAPSDLTSQRLKTLQQWQGCVHGILIVATSTAMHRLPPRNFVNRSQLHIKKGQKYNYEALINYLIAAGYERVSQVNEAGQYSQRGDVVDVFTTASQLLLPLRIEFFDDEIEEIRCFDVNSQRAVKTLDELNLSVANEYTLEKSTQDYFCQCFEDYFPNQDYHHIYQSILNGEKFAGIEYFLPLLHQQKLETIADYCPSDTWAIVMPKVKKSAHGFYRECQDIYHRVKQQGEHLALPVETLFCSIDELLAVFARRLSVQVALSTEPYAEVAGLIKLPAFVAQKMDFQDKVSRLLQYADKQQYHLVFSFSSAVRREMLESYLVSLGLRWVSEMDSLLNVTEQGMHSDKTLIAVVSTPLEHGFIDKKAALLFCTEGDIYGKVIPHKELQQEKKSTVAIKNHLNYLDLPNLQLGQLVTHIEHGVGLFRGLQVMEVSEYKHDVIAIEYSDGGMLYVPVERLHYIERYVGNNEVVSLDSLGGSSWAKRKEKAKKRIVDVAAELLDVYAKRKQLQRASIAVPDDYERFVAEFPYIETPDQSQAIADILADMEKTKPMDRLVCGDVGFGKTEVAMRASYSVVANGKQVAVLVPTTLLADQHYQSFCERFANWAVRIGVVSRLNSAKENKDILSQVANGTIDIIIGTHRLIQKDVVYHQLGLVVIDEEHRFGVRQKESFKKLRTEVDLISMTATPIPRTLNLTFSHLRDVSIIAEAPAGRLSVQTFVSEYSDNVIKEAVLRELRRGGQIYFVHNNIATIAKRRQEILDLLPDISIVVAHGQMPEKEMQRIMEGFYVGHYQILLCTTIIEMGLDVPNANTIIIDRADKFGLAQLHQLRGRVGRSSHQAYAYLFTPEMSVLKSDARKRLLAIQEAQQLGAGFRLALEDMEIRGVGEILGEEQQGHAQKIGLNLYLDMLDEAIQNQNSTAYKESAEKKKRFRECEVDLNIEAIFPEEYIDDVNMRLSFYQRLGVGDDAQLDDLWMELRDRFGKPTIEVENLFDTYRLRLRCVEVGVAELKVKYKNVVLKLSEDTSLSVEKIINYLQQYPTQWQLKKNNELLIDKAYFVTNPEESIAFSHINKLFNDLM